MAVLPLCELGDARSGTGSNRWGDRFRARASVQGHHLRLEVKGGKLACKHGQWQRWVNGRWEPAKDPFTQALDHRYALQRLIDGVPGWRGKDLLMVHGVAFPDVTAESALAPDGPREILIDARDMRALPAP